MNDPYSRDVVIFSDAAASAPSNATPNYGHADITRGYIAGKIAALKGSRYLGHYDAERHRSELLYFIPIETLLVQQAQELGIQRAEHLFGGIVAHDFMTTKSITHPLIDSQAIAPAGWNSEFPTAVASAVLDGYTAFSIDDARTAATRLLQNNPVRIKSALGIGGSGQYLVRAIDELEVSLQNLDHQEVEHYGVVLEQHLDQVTTLSVGQVELEGINIAYFGTQRLTKNHRGEQVYGGSTLQIVRGTLEILIAMYLPPALHEAIAQAYHYDDAANRHLSGLVASRRNYDIAQGLDRNCVQRSGVLEQSWRAGGATPAEIAAIEAMLIDPQIRVVRASTHEHYDLREPPANAAVYFQGDDAEVGALTKYCTIDSYEYFDE